MQISLQEDDGVFFGGIPRNVILVVKFDNGKQIRVPYSADKSISSLYEDLSAIAPRIAENALKVVDDDFMPEPALKQPSRPNKPQSTETFKDKSNIIEKEDFVTLIRLDEGRNKDASCDLQVGNEYRVIKVMSTGITKPGEDKVTQVVNGYDVVDDKADRPERTRVYPHEVMLSRKRNPPPPKDTGKIEEILPCPSCNVPNSCVLEGDTYQGICDTCMNEISIKRIIRNCPTLKCGNDVCLLDNGTNFKGICNKCKAVAEVEYA